VIEVHKVPKAQLDIKVIKVSKVLKVSKVI
jgi:hypothetical protein